MRKNMFKGMLLKDKIEMYKKEDILLFTRMIGFTGLSNKKKEELVDLVVKYLLDPNVMFYRMSTFDNQAIELFEKGIGDFYTYNEDEFDNACIFDEIDYAVSVEGVFYVFDDVASLWKRVKDERFEEYRKRASWVWKCLYWIEEMFGVTPKDVFLEVINQKQGFRMESAELKDIFDHFPKDRLWSVRCGNVFISERFVAKEARQRLIQRQRGKDYYIPTAAEVEEYYNTCALTSTASYRDMKDFMVRELHFSKEQANDLLRDIWDKVSSSEDIQENLQWFCDQIEVGGGDQIDDVLRLYMALSNDTRMLFNRGHTPSEIVRKIGFGPGNMPVITAGSTDAARMLAEVAPEIRKMGFGLDLDADKRR